MNTKEKILKEALRLFSKKGYDGVSIRNISGSVGIKESSIYNHFKNKQDLFDTLVESCWEDARGYFESRKLPFSKEDDISMLVNIEYQELLDIIYKIFGIFFDDQTNVQFRRLLLLSQYENQRAKEIYREMYVEYVLDFQSMLFSSFIEAGYFKPANPRDIALDFYGPMFLLIHSCDSLHDAKPSIERHLKQFLSIHRKEQ